MAKNKSINLLPQEEFEASLLGRVLRWAMGTFRIIVIVTEMVVMGAFLSRFWLDAQNSDLTDQIKVQAAEVQSQAEFEKEFRGLQTKLQIYKTIGASSQYSSKLDLIVSKIPSEIVLSSISLGATTLDIKGDSGSEIGIAQLIANLKAEPTFKQVTLDNLDTSKNNPGDTSFSITIAN